MQKYLKYSDILIRKNVACVELKRLSLKVLLVDYRVSRRVKDLAAFELAMFGSDFYKSKIVNRCIFTNRSRWVIRGFRISRMRFKKMAGLGLLEGVKKAGW